MIEPVQDAMNLESRIKSGLIKESVGMTSKGHANIGEGHKLEELSAVPAASEASDVETLGKERVSVPGKLW